MDKFIDERLSFFVQITLILPDNKTVPAAVLDAVKDTDHYIVKDLPLKEIVNRSFLDGFVARGLLTPIDSITIIDRQFACDFSFVSFAILSATGTLYGLSVQTKTDTDDCVAITPNGILYLSLTRDIYHQLGLVGRISQFSNKHLDRYGEWIYIYFIATLCIQTICLNAVGIVWFFWYFVVGMIVVVAAAAKDKSTNNIYFHHHSCLFVNGISKT